MTSDASFCPFCNAPLATDQSDLPEKLPCPRCGEAVSRDRWQRVVPSSAGQPAHAPVNLKTAKKNTFRWVMTIWLTMGAIALAFALYTKDFRRKNDPVPRKISSTVEIASPLDWPALAQMPPKARMLVGIHFEKLRQDAETRELLRKPLPEFLQPGLDLLKKWTRLKLDDLDHAVIGVSAEEKGILVTAIVRTRYPYEPKEVSQALVTSKSRLERLRSYFQFSTAPLGEGGVWCLEEQTLVVLWHSAELTREHLEAIPAEVGPFKGNADVRKLLEERVPKTSMVWSASQMDEKLRGWLQAMLAFQPRLGPILKLDAHAAGMFSQEGIAGLGYFHGTDVKATQELAEILRNLQPTLVKSYKVETPPPEVQGAEARWITVQIRTDQSRLRQLLGDAKK